MARPKKDDEIGAKAFLGFRIPEALRQRLETVAERNSRVLAEEARHAIEDYVARAEAAPGCIERRLSPAGKARK